MSKITNNVVCIKWGNKFDSSYVNRLYKMVKKNLTIPFRFVCFTDDKTGIEIGKTGKGIECFDLPPITFDTNTPERGWRKLSVFNKQLADLEGTALCLDIDMIIINNIDYLFQESGDFRIMKDWGFPENVDIGASSIYRFEIGKHSDILEYFEKHFDEIRQQVRNEQEYLSIKMKEKGILQYWRRDIALSFPHRCIPIFPLNFILKPKKPTNPNVKILLFHGNPLPQEAINGYLSFKRPQRTCRKTEWLKEFINV